VHVASSRLGNRGSLLGVEALSPLAHCSALGRAFP
jgi:hypothetical protein